MKLEIVEYKEVIMMTKASATKIVTVSASIAEFD